MSDNTQLSTNVGVGQVYRSLVDADGVNWGVGVTSYAVTIAENVEAFISCSA